MHQTNKKQFRQKSTVLSIEAKMLSLNMSNFHKDYSHPDYSLREKLELVITFFISDCHVIITIKAHRNGHVKIIFKIRTAFVHFWLYTYLLYTCITILFMHWSIKLNSQSECFFSPAAHLLLNMLSQSANKLVLCARAFRAQSNTK